MRLAPLGRNLHRVPGKIDRPAEFALGAGQKMPSGGCGGGRAGSRRFWFGCRMGAAFAGIRRLATGDPHAFRYPGYNNLTAPAERVCLA